jgi:hypothetical protein
VSGLARPRLAPLSSFLAGLQLCCATSLHAQALVPDPGEATVTVTYQDYVVAGHFDAQGNKNTNGSTRSHALVTEVDYGAIDGIGLTVSLPFIASKYTGPPSYFVGPFETFPGPLDNGQYHAAFQDIRVEVRRLWWAGAVPLAPFVGASFPTHDYETVGEAVPGRHRRDFQIGANAGVDLDRVWRGSYLQGRYAYGIMERVDNFPFTRSNIDVEGGFPAASRLVVRALAAWQIKHTGPSLAELAPDWVNHDRFMAPSYFNVGGGASVSLTGSTDIFALWVVTASGSNGAHRERTLAVGVSLGLRSHLRGLGGGTGAGRHASASSSVMERFR